MPMKSVSQRKWMWSTHPEMAGRWEKETPKGKKLPDHVKKAGERLKAKLAAMQAQQLIPGAPPVQRVVPPGQPPQQQPPKQPPAGGQPPTATAPQANPANGVPQQATAQVPQAATASTVAQAQQKHPNMIPSQAMVASKLDKIATEVQAAFIGVRLRSVLGR